MHIQYHLSGRGHSGRGVRLRDLSASEVENNFTGAAKIVGAEATQLELAKTTWRNAVKLMVCEFTEPCADPTAEGVKWKKVTPGMLDDLDNYFRPKDVAALEAIYRQEYELDAAGLEVITGKAIPVATEA